MRRRLPSARSLALDVSPLRDSPAYRALWLGQIVSLTGTQMRLVAVGYLVFQVSHSTVAVGLVSLAEVVPLIVFSLLGGAVADRTDRRALTARANIGLFVTSVALAVLARDAEPSLGIIFGIVALASAFAAVDRPARTAMIPTLVGPGRLAAAMALRQVAFQVTQIVGPALGGVLIAWLGDVSWVFAIDAATFLAAQLSLRWVPRMPAVTDAAATTPLEAVKEGLRFSFKTPLILGIFVIDLVAMIFGMPRAVFPALAEETFKVGASGLGLLYAAPALGALVGAMSAGWTGKVRRRGRAVLIAVAAWGLAIAFAGLSVFSLQLTLLFLAAAGAADVVSAILRGTMLQEATPEELRGRVSAVNIMVVTGGPRLGDVEAGLVAGAIGAAGSVVAGGAACLVGTVAVAVGLPALRDYRADRVLDDPTVPDSAPARK